MKTSMGNYFIKPTEQWREGDKDSLGSSLQHAIYRVSSTSSSLNNDSNFGDHVKNRNCGVIGKSSFIYLFWSIHSSNTRLRMIFFGEWRSIEGFSESQSIYNSSRSCRRVRKNNNRRTLESNHKEKKVRQFDHHLSKNVVYDSHELQG